MATQCLIPEDSDIHSHRRDNIKTAAIDEYVNRKVIFLSMLLIFHFGFKTFNNYIHGGITGGHLQGMLATLRIAIFIIPASYYNTKTKT
jgi:hypothetical protein